MPANGPENELMVCTCKVCPPQREHALGRSISGYAIYLSRIGDSTRFDRACPFHGDGGTMVAEVRYVAR